MDGQTTGQLGKLATSKAMMLMTQGLPIRAHAQDHLEGKHTSRSHAKSRSTEHRSRDRWRRQDTTPKTCSSRRFNPQEHSSIEDEKLVQKHTPTQDQALPTSVRGQRRDAPVMKAQCLPRVVVVHKLRLSPQCGKVPPTEVHKDDDKSQ